MWIILKKTLKKYIIRWSYILSGNRFLCLRDIKHDWFCLLFTVTMSLHQSCLRKQDDGCLTNRTYHRNFISFAQDACNWETIESMNISTNCCTTFFYVVICFLYRSMSGILVLQKRFDYQSLPDDLFPPILLQEMRRHILKQHYHVDPFNSLQLVRVKNILAVRISVCIHFWFIHVLFFFSEFS